MRTYPLQPRSDHRYYQRPRRRRFQVEGLEPRLPLAVTLDLAPDVGSVTFEGSTKVVTVLPGATVRFTARITNSTDPVTGFQLNFSRSQTATGALRLRDWTTAAVWPQTLDGVLATPDDGFVAAGKLGTVAIPPATDLGTFVVDVPGTVGDFLLTVNSGGANPFDTRVVGETSPLAIASHGDVLIRVAPIWMSLTRTATTTDSQGQVATIPASTSWIHEWSDFFVEIWVTAANTQNLGVARAQTEVRFDTTFFSVATLSAGPAFQGRLTSSIQESAGRVTLDGTTASAQPLGDSEFVLLARLAFEAMPGDAGVDIDLNEASHVHPVSSVWLDFRRETPARVERTDGTPISSPWGPAPNTELWPVIFDLNDDAAVEFIDFALFAAPFLDNVGGTALSFKADFDQSGRVSFNDLGPGAGTFLASFGKSRDLDSDVVFPASLVPGGPGGPPADFRANRTASPPPFDYAGIANEDPPVANYWKTTDSTFAKYLSPAPAVAPREKAGHVAVSIPTPRESSSDLPRTDVNPPPASTMAEESLGSDGPGRMDLDEAHFNLDELLAILAEQLARRRATGALGDD